MRLLRFAPILLLVALAGSGCHSTTTDEAVAADLNSSNPAVAEQARRVQQLTTEIHRQEAVIASEQEKLAALNQQLSGANEQLEGIKRQNQTGR